MSGEMELAIDARVLYEVFGGPVPDTPPPIVTLETKVREQFAFLPQPLLTGLPQLPHTFPAEGLQSVSFPAPPNL
jgi:hypothetical protein